MTAAHPRIAWSGAALVALLTCALAGCDGRTAINDAGPTPPDASSDDGPAPPDASNDTGPIPPEGSFWNQSSQSIEVSCFAFFIGSMRFKATRAQLSAEQLTLLANLQTIDSAGECLEDGMDCTLVVTQTDGSTKAMDSAAGDPTCAEPRKVISYASFDPFRQTLNCQHAKNLTFNPQPVTADPRCFNGLFAASGATIAVPLDVADATATHHIELDDCDQPGRLNKLRFAVFDADATVPIASSSPSASAGIEGTCAELDLTFPRAGRFELRVTVDPDVTLLGDFWLRFY